jgi:hypothetical protein
MSSEMAGHSGAVAARGGTPFLPWMIFEEEEYAPWCPAQPEPLTQVIGE